MSTVVVSPDDALVAVQPLARETRKALELAREALTRVPEQPWGEFDGPSIEQIVDRIDRVLKLEREVASELGMRLS